MRRISMLAMAVALAAAACGGAAAPPDTTPQPGTALPDSTSRALVVDGPGRYAAELESAGTVRRFVVHVPGQPTEPAPLVVVFHGFTGNPAEAERLTEMHLLGEREGFVTAYPAARGLIPAWRADRGAGDDADVTFVRDLVAVVGEAVPIDPTRVFVTGMSNGGGMVDRLACEAADLVAAAAPVAGAYSPGPCAPDRPVPLLAFHGTADFIVPFPGFGRLLPAIPAWAADWAARNDCDERPPARPVSADVSAFEWPACAADVALYVVDGGGHGWPGSPEAERRGNSTMSVSASEVIWSFFAAHPRE